MLLNTSPLFDDVVVLLYKKSKFVWGTWSAGLLWGQSVRRVDVHLKLAVTDPTHLLVCVQRLGVTSNPAEKKQHFYFNIFPKGKKQL